jgi:hypothetical protein
MEKQDILELEKLIKQFYEKYKDRTFYLWGRPFVFDTWDTLREVKAEESEGAKCLHHYLPFQHFLVKKMKELGI